MASVSTPPQGTDMPPKSTGYQEVGTMDLAGLKPSLNKSACQWTKRDLAKLGVDYTYDRFDEIVFGNRGDVPTELSQGSYPSVHTMLTCSHRGLCSKNRVCEYASHFSGGSTATSSSVESKPETYAQDVARDLLKATYITIGTWLEGME
jgi:hypothetical protein